MIKGLKIIFFSFLILSCSKNESRLFSVQDEIVKSIFSDSVQSLNINVLYEPAAIPYTGNLGVTPNNVWDITEDSLEALFTTHQPKTLLVPHLVSEMSLLPNQNKMLWSKQELYDLAVSNISDFKVGTTINLSVFILKGQLAGSSTSLGYHIEGLPVAFVFKDVVVSAGGDAQDQSYMEQAAIVQHLGHAIGLVNKGLAMIDSHEDPMSDHNSTDVNCVMNKSFNSSLEALNSLEDFIISNSLVLFGAKSLNDARSYLL